MERYLNKIICGDCADVMRQFPDNCIDLTVTSPPYDNLRTYNGYEFDFQAIAKELYRVTKPGGVVVWVVGDATKNYCESLTSFKQAIYFVDQCGFNLFDTMIYQKANCPMRGSLLGYNQVFEYMFVFSKGKPKATNILFDRQNSSAGIKTLVTHRRVTGEIEKQNIVEIKEFGRRYNIWTYDNGKGVTSKDDIAFEHPAVFPEQLAHDHIITWSNPGDLVLDPMCGSGTTCKMAALSGRDYIGIDISQKYVDIANQRIKEHSRQATLFAAGE